MPDDATDLEDDEVTEPELSPTVNDEAAARRLKAQRDAAKRELLFVKAGIDTDSPQGKLAMKGYDGDLSVDAIKTWHSEVFGAPPVKGDEPTPAELEIAKDRQFVATGGDGTPVQEDPEHPHARGLGRAGDVWRQTRDENKAAKAFLDEVFESAYSKGDGRVLIDQLPDGSYRHRAAS